MGLAARLRGFMGLPEDEYYEEEETQASDQDPVQEESGAYEVVLTKPERFDDASSIADHLNANRIVMLNLETTPRETARRLIDFLGGAAYARDGLLKRVAANIYLITPYNVEYMDELEDTISGGLF